MNRIDTDLAPRCACCGRTPAETGLPLHADRTAGTVRGLCGQCKLIVDWTRGLGDDGPRHVIEYLRYEGADAPLEV